MLQLIILEYFYDLLPLHQTMQKVFTFYLSTIFIVPKYTKPLRAMCRFTASRTAGLNVPIYPVFFTGRSFRSSRCFLSGSAC
jgi:hypothetical protein